MFGCASPPAPEPAPAPKQGVVRVGAYAAESGVVMAALAVRQRTARQNAAQGRPRDPACLAAGRMLAVAAQFDLVACLFAVIAAVLAVRAARIHGAVTGRVSALVR